MTVIVTTTHRCPEEWSMHADADEPDEVKATAITLTRQVQAGLRGIPSGDVLLTYVDQARNRAKRVANQQTDPQRKMAFALANLIGLDRDDRLALAESVVGRDVASWNDLSWEELGRVIDNMDGYVKIRHLRIERR